MFKIAMPLHNAIIVANLFAPFVAFVMATMHTVTLVRRMDIFGITVISHCMGTTEC
jgi:hypothetical protein